MTSRLREALSRRRILWFLVLGGVLLAAALIVPRLPRSVAGVATLGQCYWGWPVVAFEGEDWKGALPDNLRANAPGSIPIAQWPNGSHFDEARGALLDARGSVLFRNGDRVRIVGSIVEVHGDPSPCFYRTGASTSKSPSANTSKSVRCSETTARWTTMAKNSGRATG